MNIKDELARRKAVCDAATPGPWQTGPHWLPKQPQTLIYPHPSYGDGRIAEAVPQYLKHEVPNAAFIAHARQGYPETLDALAACVEVMEGEVNRMRATWGEQVSSRMEWYQRHVAALARVAELMGVKP